jgi:hypothetical protein
MNRWYSDRGAKRGLLSITVFATLWLGWAIAFSAGLVGPTPAVDQRIELTANGPRVDAPCKCEVRH